SPRDSATMRTARSRTSGENLTGFFIVAPFSQEVEPPLNPGRFNQQLCRWLLLSIDRLPSNDLTMTQELIANMLGVRRSGVTEAALKLQAAGLIRYSHGHIAVLDRAGLEQRVCECYAVVKREFERLLPDILKI
ncbi:Crp/Fnr family transcriptional regulator, partial [Cupriavidus campinensis]|uniref:Crp/Fnr family transcriptional regulator n=1 Tax=Cupriavidus campinensis TaxID=151783 RepID=UPI001FE85080